MGFRLLLNNINKTPSLEGTKDKNMKDKISAMDALDATSERSCKIRYCEETAVKNGYCKRCADSWIDRVFW